MKILMLLEGEFPHDDRVHKEMMSLAYAGHDVSLACVTHDVERHGAETRKFYTVYRSYMAKKSFDRWRVTPLIIPYYFQWWRGIVERLFNKINFEVIHVHDLPLSKIGYYYKKTYGVKLVCDQHEFYSEWIPRTAHMRTILGRIISLFSNWRRYERVNLQRADCVITVSELLRQKYVNKYNLSSIEVLNIPNTPSSAVFNLSNVDDKILNLYKDDFVIFYAGIIDILRGVEMAISALPEIIKRIPNAKIVLAGRIANNSDPLKCAQKFEVSDYVKFIGWIPIEKLPSFIYASSVCFFTPPTDSDEINNTIATKVYQYAIMGRPQIVSNAKMMKEFVESNELGVSVRSSSEFTQKVIDIFENKQYFKEYKLGKKFTWEYTISPLLEVYGNFK